LIWAAIVEITDMNSAAFSIFAASISTRICSCRTILNFFTDKAQEGVISRDKNVADKNSKDNDENQVFHV